MTSDRFIEIDGKWYHRIEGTDEPMCWEDGEPMAAYVCLCYAKCASECVCGAWDFAVDCRDEL